jgi:hypothetical protein
LGLGWELALSCFDLRGHPAGALGDLAPAPHPLAAGKGSSVDRLFPEAAAPFFQALRVRIDGSWPLEPGGFRILVIERGQGELSGSFGRTPLRAGETWLLPAAVDGAVLAGVLDLLVCLTGAP